MTTKIFAEFLFYVVKVHFRTDVVCNLLFTYKKHRGCIRTSDFPSNYVSVWCNKKYPQLHYSDFWFPWWHIGTNKTWSTWFSVPTKISSTSLHHHLYEKIRSREFHNK